MRSSPFLRVLSLLALFSLAGCADWPRDQSGTTERIRKTRVFEVGEVAATQAAFKPLQAQEKRIIEAAAKRLGARVEWKRGHLHRLLEEVEERKLPIVAATLPTDSPFADRVAMTKPYSKKGPHEKDYALAVAPGENALLFLLDQEIERQKKG